MLQLYSITIKRYYMQRYSNQILITQKIPSFVLDSIYTDVQKSFLEEFLRRYLIQLKDPPNNPINYRINFKEFSIETNTW